jgi:trimethylamine-N-oxide reductase (cytochrome c)
VRFGEVTLESLEAGRALFIERCSMCHEAPAVTSNTPEEWEVEVSRMYERAGLDEGQRGLVLRYLQTFAGD